MPKLARVSIIVVSLLAILAAITVVVLPIALSRYIRRNVVTILRERFDSDVEIKGLRVIALPMSMRPLRESFFVTKAAPASHR